MTLSTNSAEFWAYHLARAVEREGAGELGNPSPDIDLLTWAILYRAQLRPGKFFTLRDHHYLREMYTCDHPWQMYMKGSQVGISEMLVSFAFWVADVKRGDVLYVMPTTDDVGDFSRMRFGPALEASPYLSRRLTQPAHGNLRSNPDFRGSDKVNLKRFRDNWLIFRGGTVGKDGRARQLKSVPADVLIGDEVDEMDSRTLPIARKRLGHSYLKWERLASTPTYPGMGIDEYWQLSDQREWFVPCPHCGERQTFDFWKQVVIEKNDLDWPVAWHGQSENRAFIACIKCGKEVDHTAPGQWVAAHPGREWAGFHPTKLMSSQTPLIDIVRSFRATDETKRKEATNQHLGLTFTPKGGRLTDEALNACKRDYAMGPHPDAGASMGVDIGNLLHVIIRARKDGDGQRRLLYAGEVVHFYELEPLMKQYGVETCVVDSQPEKKKAREFQASYPDGRVWLCYYLDGKQPEIAAWDWRKGVVNADRTWSLDTTMAGFYDKSNILPQDIVRETNYYPHMKAEIRTVEEAADGNKISRYINSGPDHFCHAENYCLIASLRPVGWAR